MSLTLRSVCKQFGPTTAVSGLSLAIPKGSIYGFLGPNGAGKTTTIRMIMSILYPDSGSISLLGASDPTLVKDRLGYLPEEKGLYKKMKTVELVAYFGRLKGMTRQAARREADAMLLKYGLGHARQQRCDALSKGMGQKVQIITTLIHQPELVILDEPFSGLDPINVEVIRDVILQLKRDGRTVIFSTHVMEQAEQICDYIVLINRGRKVLDGTLREVKSHGEKTIALDYHGDGTRLAGLPGVIRVNDMGQAAELSLADDADGQEILSKLIDRVEVRGFNLKEPSLHEVFVREIRESPE